MDDSAEKPMQPLRFEAAGRSDIGRMRRSNQDRFGIAEGLGLAVVCDGMGGHAGGEIASALATESFLEVARQEIKGCGGAPDDLTERSLRRAAAAANCAVWMRASHEVDLRGMGTTLVAARLEERELTVLHVGDSRAYLVREGVARQLTDDHSFVGEQMRGGAMTEEQARRSPMQSVITRAVGIGQDVQPDVCAEILAAGDVVLLCSDGLTRHVADEEIGRIAGGRESLDSGCASMIDLANERGGSDNITCVLMRVGL